MINKLEAVGIFVCVGIMAIALFLMRFDSNASFLSQADGESQAASVIVSEDESKEDLSASLKETMDQNGTVTALLIDDIVEGTGKAVEEGSVVRVHYIGTLQNGEQFDNSYLRGEPFSFKVGAGDVIEGWDQGLLGMKEGGQRIIVVPAEMAYGNRVVGPIPANSTLVFAIELVEVN
jgi:FKBP-type peptidyl-prolyl cis-trans isomerase